MEKSKEEIIIQALESKEVILQGDEVHSYAVTQSTFTGEEREKLKRELIGLLIS